MTDDELDLADTQQLVAALRRRSRAFFCCVRPLADDPDHAWSRYFGVDGRDTSSAEENERVLGLIQRATHDLLMPNE